MANCGDHGGVMVAGPPPQAPHDPSDPNYEMLRWRWEEWQRVTRPEPVYYDFNGVDQEVAIDTAAPPPSNQVSNTGESDSGIEVNGM